MTQLIVSLEDASMLSEIKKAIRLLRGVVSVKVAEAPAVPNAMTVEAIEELNNGHTIVCEDFESYLKLVKGDLPD